MILAMTILEDTGWVVLSIWQQKGKGNGNFSSLYLTFQTVGSRRWPQHYCQKVSKFQKKMTKTTNKYVQIQSFLYYSKYLGGVYIAKFTWWGLRYYKSHSLSSQCLKFTQHGPSIDFKKFVSCKVPLSIISPLNASWKYSIEASKHHEN